MRIQSIIPATVKSNFLNNTKAFIQTNSDTISQSLSDNVNFGVGEDYGGVNFDAVENTNPQKPGFKKGLLGIVTVLTFPISVPIMIAYESYKDKHKDDIKSNINPDNIED